VSLKPQQRDATFGNPRTRVSAFTILCKGLLSSITEFALERYRRGLNEDTIVSHLWPF
jgi:hypothetical protein